MCTGLQAAIEKKIKELTVYGDSALVMCQLNGEWETRDSKLVPYQEFIKGLIEQFEEIPQALASRGKLPGKRISNLSHYVQGKC